MNHYEEAKELQINYDIMECKQWLARTVYFLLCRWIEEHKL